MNVCILAESIATGWIKKLYQEAEKSTHQRMDILVLATKVRAINPPIANAIEGEVKLFNLLFQRIKLRCAEKLT